MESWGYKLKFLINSNYYFTVLFIRKNIIYPGKYSKNLNDHNIMTF